MGHLSPRCLCVCVRLPPVNFLMDLPLAWLFWFL
jgi:hypothetical protein